MSGASETLAEDAAAGSSGGATARRGRPTAWHLGALAATLILPILGFVGVLLWQVAAGERARLEQEASQQARAIAVAIDRELAALRSAVEVLALSPQLQAGDWASFDGQARDVEERLGVAPVLRDLSGRPLGNQPRSAGEALPSAPLPIDAEAIRTGRSMVSDLIEGPSAREARFAVVVPVARSGTREAIATLASSLSVERLRAILADAEAPDAWILAIVDRSGTLMARSRGHDEFVGKPAAPDLIANSAGREGTWRGRTVDGHVVFGAYARTTLSGWRVAVGVRASDLNAPLLRSLRLLAGLGAGLGLLGALVAYGYGRRITRHLRTLAAGADALGRGAPVPGLAGPLAELNGVGDQLVAASRRLRDREAALARARADAERVAAVREAILGQLAEGVIVTDASGRIVFVNEAATRLHGVARLDVAPEDYARTYSLFTVDGAPYPSDELPLARAARRGETVRDARWRIRRPDGTEVLAIGNAQPVRAPDGTRLGSVLTLRDDTRREADERRLRRLNETLEEQAAELTESNGELQRYAYIVSHDLRAPLVNIMGFTGELEATREEIRAELAGSPKAEAIDRDMSEALSYIKAAITKMEGLIGAILKLSREGRRTFRPEPLDLTALVQGLIDAQHHQAVSADAEVVVEGPLPDLVADRLAVEQIVGNLVDNALKYLSPNRPGRIAISGERAGSRVRLTVRDNGRGIAAGDHARVFELFRRAGPQDRPGEGIGLAHVKALVRSLGGRIELDSTLGAGSAFTVTLPARPARARESGPAPGLAAE